jgi:hypothetical protein
MAPQYLTWRAFTDSYPELAPSVARCDRTVNRAAARKSRQAISVGHPDTSSFEVYTSTGRISMDSFGRGQIPRHASPELAINRIGRVGPNQFADEGFVTQVATALHKTGATPQHLKLEITQNMLMNDFGSGCRAGQPMKNRAVALVEYAWYAIFYVAIMCSRLLPRRAGIAR